jgi:hypothetical protein
VAFSGQLLILLLAATLGLALAAWLVHAPGSGERAGQEGGS